MTPEIPAQNQRSDNARALYSNLIRSTILRNSLMPFLKSENDLFPQVYKHPEAAISLISTSLKALEANRRFDYGFVYTASALIKLTKRLQDEHGRVIQTPLEKNPTAIHAARLLGALNIMIEPPHSGIVPILSGEMPENDLKFYTQLVIDLLPDQEATVNKKYREVAGITSTKSPKDFGGFSAQQIIGTGLLAALAAAEKTQIPFPAEIDLGDRTVDRSNFAQLLRAVFNSAFRYIPPPPRDI